MYSTPTLTRGIHPKKFVTLNEHFCLIKLHVLHESDNLCRINTMFEDLLLAFCLFITILQRYFCERYCIFYGGRVS